MSSSDFLHIVKERGFFYQCTDEDGLQSALQNKLVGYCGFDPSADSLTIGNLVAIMFCDGFKKQAINPLLWWEVPQAVSVIPQTKMNSALYFPKNRSKKIWRAFANPLVNSSALAKKKLMRFWLIIMTGLKILKYLSFLRDYGKHVSVNRMLTFESVKRRLDREQPLSFLEFNYMLFQAYDFIKLNQDYQCTPSTLWGRSMG